MKNNKSIIINTILFSIPMIIVSSVFLIGFYPAIMTPDSFNQWNQINTLNFNNWHPVVHTWFTMLIVGIFGYRPQAVAMVQIVMMSLLIGYILALFKEYGVKKKVLILAAIIIALMPQISINNICLWKDIVYTFFITLLTVLMVRVYVEGEDAFKSKGFCIVLFVALLGTKFFRSNGVLSAVSILILLFFLVKKYRKKIIIIGSAFIISSLIISGPVFSLFNVKEGSKSEAFGALVNAIGRTVKYDSSSISTETRKKIDKIMPYEKWGECYNPISTNGIKFNKDFKTDVINNDIPGFIGIWFEVFRNSPMETIKSQLHLTEVIWDPVSKNINTNIEYPMQKNIVNIRNSNVLGKVSINIRRICFKLLYFKPVLWSPAIPMYIFIGIMLYAFIKYRNKNLLLVICPLLFNVLGMIVGIPAQDFRYMLPNYTILICGVLLCFNRDLMKGSRKED